MYTFNDNNGEVAAFFSQLLPTLFVVAPLRRRPNGRNASITITLHKRNNPVTRKYDLCHPENKPYYYATFNVSAHVTGTAVPPARCTASVCNRFQLERESH